MVTTSATSKFPATGQSDQATGRTARTAPKPAATPIQDSSRRVGYLVAIAVDAALLFIVDKLSAWDLAFLTNDLDRVTPIISLSLLVGAAVNAAFLIYDPQWFKSLGQISSLGVSLAATMRIYDVFPFDFNQYTFEWAILVRIGLVVAIMGTLVGLLVEVVKLLVRSPRPGWSPTSQSDYR
jgi:hypothetical protein